MNLGSIHDLYDHSGPFVSVHVDVSRNTEDAVQRIEARWTTLRHQLEHEGVNASLVERIGERVRERHDVPGEVRRTVIASGDQIVFDDLRAGHSMWPERVTCGPLPDLAGWLHQVDGEMPFLLVLADREGADIDFYRAESKTEPEHREVHGERLHLHKVPVGDWAHKQFQRRAENVWAKNAREVADVVRSVYVRHRPRVVLVAGDPRARCEIAHELEGSRFEVVQVESGGRAAGSSSEALWDDVHKILARLEAEDEQRVTGRLLEATGQGAGAVRGLSEVVDALVKGQVERLVLDLQKAHEMTLKPAEHPGLSLPEAAEKEELPADLALVAAGARTDADLSLLPSEQSKGAGVAALLRWDDRAEG
jgi:hypothetical protein